ncbi:lysophosphatidic acid receptor 3-like [Stylophora pistillata]|uniref:lysophosphatidic acid receptor 3-like n=1 Tax=Stylophora pistillata TaxID=50429 RepID=UPI000C04380A|nr:lysophosphatidic acid receptor 3-like [Stylophora pistillata]
MEISAILMFSVVFFLEGVFILTGNIFSIFVFWKHRAKLKRTTYPLVNLAVADILVAVEISFLVCSEIKYLATKRISQDDWLLITNFALDGFCGVASLLSLLVIALERLYAVHWPFRHRTLKTRSYTATILLIWIIAAASAYLYLETIYNFFQLKFVCSLMLVFIVGSALVVIIVACNLIYTQTRRNNPEGFNERRAQQNKKLTKTLFIITVLSIVCWLPGIILSIRVNFIDDLITLKVILLVKMIQFFNCGVDPIIYTFRMPLVKTELMKIFSKFSPKRKQRHDATRIQEMAVATLWRTTGVEISLQNFETRL